MNKMRNVKIIRGLVLEETSPVFVAVGFFEAAEKCAEGGTRRLNYKR